MKYKKTAIFVLVVYFIISILTAYGLDLEVVLNPAGMGTNIIWFPPFSWFLQWWGPNVDPLFMARPTWFWCWLTIEAIFFGLYAIAGLYYLYKKSFDKLLYHWTTKVYLALLLIANVMVILEEAIGQYPAKIFGYLLTFNAVWLIGPGILITLLLTKSHLDNTSE